ncbi:MAG: c-type cytochrome [Acidobacteria bacterium]|nr:c-type cytochrome [Acidobacteriota bacterium]
MAGLGLLALTVIARWAGPGALPERVEPILPLTPAMVPLVTGDEPLAQLFAKAGCPVCHTIPGIPGAEGRVGPKLVLAQTGPARLADPRYRGQAKSVREYVVESILNPGAYVVPGFPDRTMPSWYGQKLSAAALEKIATYLESLASESAPRSPDGRNRELHPAGG